MAPLRRHVSGADRASPATLNVEGAQQVQEMQHRLISTALVNAAAVLEKAEEQLLPAGGGVGPK